MFGEYGNNESFVTDTYTPRAYKEDFEELLETDISDEVWDEMIQHFEFYEHFEFELENMWNNDCGIRFSTNGSKEYVLEWIKETEEEFEEAEA
tara:strand:+ start:1323 stop:1601 length:279 start_codon:yes stop_codon:yes gene_type:complete